MALRDYFEIMGDHKNRKLDWIQRKVCELTARKFTMADRLSFKKDGRPNGTKSIYWIDGASNPQYDEIRVTFRVYR